MEARVINSYKELKNFVMEKLQLDVAVLPQKYQVITESPRSIEKYQLNHVKGALLMMGKGADYKGDDSRPSKAENCIIQDKDYQFAIVTVIRKLDDGMDPEEYLDFVENSVSGLEIDNHRWWRKIYAIESEFIKEENGVWWHMVTFSAPLLFTEQAVIESGE